MFSIMIFPQSGILYSSDWPYRQSGNTRVSITYATPEDILLLRKLEKAIKEIITKYDEKGNIRRIKGPSAKKKVILPGMYKPTKKKEHKVLGHKGADMRKKKRRGKRKEAAGEIVSA